MSALETSPAALHDVPDPSIACAAATGDNTIPIDPEDLDRIAPEDLDVCDVCGGSGGIWPLSLDPRDVEDCPGCGGDGVIPGHGGAA